MNKILPFKKAIYCFFVLIGLFSSQFAFSQAQTPVGIPLGSATFNPCDRKLSFHVQVHEMFSTNDDQLDYYHVYISAPGITEFEIARILHDDGTNAVSSIVDGDGNDWYYGSNPTAGYTINWTGNYSSGDFYYMQFEWVNIPSTFFGKTITLKITGSYEGGGQNGTYTFDMPKPETPGGLQASQDQYCDRVALSWNEVDLTACNTYDEGYVIYRDNVYLSYVSGSANTTYNDYTASKTTQHTYKIASYYQHTSGVLNQSGFSLPATGKRINILEKPAGVAATKDDCAGNITVSWTWGGNYPSSFVIERATDTGFTTGLTTIPVAADVREYLDESVPLRNVIYYYRVFSINVCSERSLASSTVQGMAPSEPLSPASITTTANVAANNIIINWPDNSSNETGFIIKRSLIGGGGTSLFEVGANITTYTDNAITNCVSYIYEVVAKNACAPNGSISSNSTTVKLMPIITNTFSGKTFKVSKGYFPSYIQISWTNNNDQQINAFKIRRRLLGSTDPMIQIASLNKGTNIYLDNTAEAGIMYEYEIQAEGQCENSTLYSETVSDIGFRSPSGIVNGHVSYKGGIAVEGARVIVSKTSGSTGTSLKFTSGDKVEAPHSVKLMPTTNITLSAWARPEDLSTDMSIVSKTSGANGYGLDYIAATNNVRFWINDGSGKKITSVAGMLTVGNYTSLTGTFDGNQLKLYVNGVAKDSLVAATTIAANTSNLFIGSTGGTTDFYNGYIDEVLVWNVSRTSTEVLRDFSRIMNGNESGLVAYWRMDEAVGNFIFDASNTSNVYNENHAAITGVEWSTLIPASTQLGLVGITNATGDYTISNIRFNGAGETFTLTPFFGTHNFDPSSKVLYIGDGASVQNNQDFTDISSFQVTGTVKFKNTSCFVKDVFLKIDGNLVIKDGSPVKTAADGTFEIEVPIGKHKISVEMNGHQFETGMWPTNGTAFDFQAPIPGIEFIDSTLITVIGRVVGGLREGDKAPGLGRSVNNIGKATFQFTAQQNSGCTLLPVVTDNATGEYIVKLPPLKYIVESLKIPSDLSINFGVLDLVDLSNNPSLKTAIDTVWIPGTALISRIDSIHYHVRNDYIYRSAPEMTVTDDQRLKNFTGDTVSLYIDKLTGDTTRISLANDPFGYPVFTKETNYKTRISVFERYINKDVPATPITDKVPVKDGKITINNNIAGNDAEIIQLSGGDTLYTFKAGSPNMLADLTSPQYSYTQTFQILVEVGTNSVVWEPRATGDKIFRGFVFGGKSKGNAFATQGPQVVDKILRDPPGSGSYSSIEQGTSTTTFSSWQVNTDASLTFDKNVLIGTEFTLGLGMQTPTKIQNSLSFGTTVERTITEEGEHKETVTYNQTYQTSSSSEDVGASADLFIGKSQNILFGATDNLYLLPDNLCSLPGITCTGISSNGFQIGKRTGIFVIPGGPETMFIYDQGHIENYLIPDIKRLRNSLFVQQPDKYLSKLTASNPNFGTNNDDPVWGTEVSSADPKVTNEPEDNNGSSYTFTPATGSTGGIDSVRFYNQQIRLWQEAIALNEKEKVQAVLDKNISFNAGPQYTSVQSTEVEDTRTSTWEVGLTEDIKLKLEAEVGGTGFETENHIAFSVKGGQSSGTTTVTSTSYTYVLADDNKGDYFSVDVKKCSSGNGPVFKTVAGKTSCPYEDAIKTQFYQPGTELSAATMQREIPTLAIRPNKLINVPSDQVAVFNLSLGNESASDDDMTYVLKVLENTNPFGAIIEVDGASPNRSFDVLAGSSINKQLTVKKGSVENIYDNIQVVFQSACDAIADTVTFSVHFLPSCSPVSFIQPENQWVVNNSFNDTLPVVIGGYDINYESLQRLQFQYKPSSSANWINLQSFWKDTTGMGDPLAKSISVTDFYTTYPWELSQLPDGDYDIRSVTKCSLADVASTTYSGHIDRVNPHPFGNPQPADGILSPNDEILIQFNEVVDAGKLTYDNFDVRGIINGTALRHAGSISFDGDANHYMEIPDGLNISKSSLSVEFWAKRSGTSEEVVVSQGKTEAEAMYVGFDANNKIKFSIAGLPLLSSVTVTDNDWHHYACTYDAATLEAEIYLDGVSVQTANSFEAIYEGNGVVKVGKSSFDPALPFHGNVHELRIWNKARSQADIIPTMAKMLTGREMGLIGNWHMDEAFGTVAKDNARSRHALVKSTWAVEPSGRSLALDGVNDYFEANGGAVAFTEEMDFTLEFWFKGSNGNNVCLFSNGKGDGTDSNLSGWSVNTDANGNIKVNNGGRVFNAVNTNYFDNNWHHFALVMRRLGNTLSFVDGNLKGSITSGDWKGFGGAKLWVGARGWYTGTVTNFDQYFAGSVDEIRIWSSARVQDQIQRDMNSRLFGDEFGLKAYYPFESYQDMSGVMVLTETMDDQSEATNTALAVNGALYSTETPTIKLKRPIQKVNFSYSVNQDKIIITPTDPAYLIENCILDITVRDVRDLSNNKMQSPATWSAYIDKNQVVWEDEEKNFVKEFGADLTFTAKILNNGGNQFDYTIGNLPSWLKATPANGQIEPKSSEPITFTVDPGINIGNYSQNLHLTTSFGFDEILVLNINVFKNPPADWKVNENDFQYSMNVIGQVSIGGIISTDKNDMVAAFVNGECRGIGYLEYLPSYDMYEVYLSVFSNSLSGENVVFKIWDASEGKINSKVTPDFNFVANASHGTPSVPILFNAANYIVQDIPLSKGWKWISFNLNSPELTDLNLILKDVSAQDKDLIKGMSFYDEYNIQNGWIGTITGNGGLRMEEMYKAKFSKTDTIVLEGERPDPSLIPINIVQGWNWIGFISQKNLPINEALSNLNASSGDLIKSQFKFAIYDQNNGWVGNLTTLKPGEGYMYQSAQATIFKFPKPPIGNLKLAAGIDTDSTLLWQVKPEDYRDNASLVAKVKVPDGESPDNDHVLGAFVNGVCRGAVPAQYNNVLKEYTYFMTIYSNTVNEKVEFKWQSKNDGAIYDVNESITFVNNKVNGSIQAPSELTLKGISENAVFVHPNPVIETATITVSLKKDSKLVIEVFDILGNKVEDITDEYKASGTWRYTWNAGGRSSGVYFIKVITDSGSDNFKISKY